MYAVMLKSDFLTLASPVGAKGWHQLASLAKASGRLRLTLSQTKTHVNKKYQLYVCWRNNTQMVIPENLIKNIDYVSFPPLREQD